MDGEEALRYGPSMADRNETKKLKKKNHRSFCGKLLIIEGSNFYSCVSIWHIDIITVCFVLLGVGRRLLNMHSGVLATILIKRFNNYVMLIKRKLTEDIYLPLVAIT